MAVLGAYALSAALAFSAAAEAPGIVSFPTPDGGVVSADVYGAGEHAVVLAHGGRFTKESWQEQAPILADAGFHVLAIDFRGRGRSHGGPNGNEDDVHLDVLAAIRYMHEQRSSTVSVVGASFGGDATARAAVEVEPGEIDSIVLLAAADIDAPEKMKGRKLFITTRNDFRGGGIKRLPSIRDSYERAPGPKELVILDGSAHAQWIFETEQGARLMQEILRFLQADLLQADR